MTLQDLHMLWPEIVLLIGACGCLFLGMARTLVWRRTTAWLTVVTLLVAAALVRFPPTDMAKDIVAEASMPQFIKWWVLMMGLILWTLSAGLPGKLKQTRANDAATPLTFDPGNSIRGEYFAFFLFSLAGVLLCAGAGDLAWLFLALELTSLPTYVMVVTARDNPQSQESGVKYFFLGAMSAALFLYGFTLIYGATGTTVFSEIRQAVATLPESQQPMLLLGVILSVLGIAFKIAAFPMHFYAADVYQGAATPVTAFLAFVPKAAGFVALILVLSLVGWPLPAPVQAVLWVMAALTMTIGNVLGVLQNNVKRVLAYSSVAHSGYMLLGLLAGMSMVTTATTTTGEAAPWGAAMGNGLAGVLFYLVAYGFATVAAFAVLGCLERHHDEAQTYDDLAGLVHRDAKLALVMLLAMLSLVGLPPLMGFLGKVYLFEAAISTGSGWMVALVVIAVINSAISAVYYLRIGSVCFFGQPTAPIHVTAGPLRITGAMLAALASLLYGLVGHQVVQSAAEASTQLSLRLPVQTSAEPSADEPTVRITQADAPPAEAHRIAASSSTR